MKRQIRRSVFETNSSSTHSVSIYNKSKLMFSDIPKNSTVVLDDTFVTPTDICDELGKLNFIVRMLASMVDHKIYDEELEINSFKQMINFKWFKWLAEVVKEESNTEVIYKCPTYSHNGKEVAYSPYYDTVYSDYDSIENIFTDDNLDIMESETLFKERVKDIIYNKSISIGDKENDW